MQPILKCVSLYTYRIQTTEHFNYYNLYNTSDCFKLALHKFCFSWTCND